MALSTTSSTSHGSLPLDPGVPVAAVCHDAGAANIILAEMTAHPQVHWLPVFDGPALSLWDKAGRPGRRQYRLQEALELSRWVLTGTGWASDLEHEGRRLARLRGLQSAGVVDHWVNYRERFVRHEQTVLPDEIWIFDEPALKIARSLFHGPRLVQRPNLYLRAQAEEVLRAGEPQAGRVLYLLEPIRFSWPGLAQPGEFEALDHLVARRGALARDGAIRLRLRLHPSEPAGKYDAWIARQPALDVSLDEEPTLARAIARAEWVAGCETAALAVALAAGRKAVSTLPAEAPRCRLPHPELLHLRDMADEIPAATGRVPSPHR